MTVLQHLQDWYTRQCDEVWEHKYGVRIESCDNPGWWVHIDLRGTQLDGVPFTPISQGVDEKGFPAGPRWINCCVKEGAYSGAGDETKLEEIIQVFLDWDAAVGR